MIPRRLIWKVALLYLLVIGMCTMAIAWFAGASLKRHDYQRLRDSLTQQAHLMMPQVRRALGEGHPSDAAALADLCRNFGRRTGSRLTLIDASGRVLGDSSADPREMDNHGRRPEVLQAYAGHIGYSLRYSHTLGRDMMYVAMPIESGARGGAVVRIAGAIQPYARSLGMVYGSILIGGAVMALLALSVTLWIVSRQVIRPLEQLREGAQRFAAGDLAHTLPIPDSQEFAELAERLNAMARQLDEKIRTITSQSQERQAILASMVEGMFAVDDKQCIIAINRAAADLLEVDRDTVQGQPVHQVVRNAALRQFVSLALEAESPIEQTISLPRKGAERLCQVHGSQWRSGQAHRQGAVIVLNDQTRLHQLEKVRQEFVANVSHELKTPITTIKASIETLLSERNPKDASPAWRFAETIVRQADRLGAIIEDLLMLARLEQEDRPGQIALTPGSVGPVVRAACETCQTDADARQIAIDCQVDEALQARLNATLLEQAVVNLLNNAIKYSPASTTVRVTAERQDDQAVISVIDQGQGIEAEHLPRLFERFYRTDRARSRALGGTGLGLAIVKHVANAHNGRVSVTSIAAPQPDHGSVFRIHLPLG